MIRAIWDATLWTFCTGAMVYVLMWVVFEQVEARERIPMYDLIPQECIDHQGKFDVAMDGVIRMEIIMRMMVRAYGVDEARSICDEDKACRASMIIFAQTIADVREKFPPGEPFCGVDSAYLLERADAVIHWEVH